MSTFHAQIHEIKKKKKQEKAHCDVNTLFIGVIILQFMSSYAIGKGNHSSIRYLKQFLFNIRKKLYYFRDGDFADFFAFADF